MRIRTIKPEFWLHEGLCGCSEFARLMAIALLNWADDEGYFMAHPALLRGSLFPFLDDSKKIPGTLQELSRVGWIEHGTDDQGRPVGRVVNFSKHQRVDKPQSSKIKASSVFQEQSTNDPGMILDASKEERNGREGIGRGITADIHTQPQALEAPGVAGPPCTEEEAWRYAQSLGMSFTREGVAFWHSVNERNGWTIARSNGAMVPVVDWRAALRSSSSWVNAELSKSKSNDHNHRTNRQAPIVTRNTAPLPAGRPSLNDTAV